MIGHRVTMFFFGLIGVAIFPVLTVSIPPLADYPNHLARVYILSNIGYIPQLAEYYRDVTSAQPNLALDAVVATIGHFIPLETAGKVFVALTIISMIGGTVALHRALHGRMSLWPLVAVFFVYNRLFLWGFLAYLFTLGCALAAFAAWIALRERPTVRVVAASLLASLLYLGHLYAFGVYALCVAGYELVVLWDKRQQLFQSLAAALLSTMQFLPAIYLFLFVSPTSDAAGITKWGPIWRKLDAPANLIYNYHLIFDLLCLGALAALFALGLICRRVTIHRLMIGPLVFFFVAFLVMPDQLFSSYGADRRIPIAIALIAIAASDWRPVTWAHRIVGALIILFIVRIALITQVWVISDGVYSEYLRAIDRLPYGAKLLVVVAHSSMQSLPAIPAFEIANMAIIRRNAFVPSLFAFPKDAGQAVAFSDEMKSLAEETPHHIVLPHTLEALGNEEFAGRNGPFRPDLLARYDYALIVNENALPAASNVPVGERVFSGADFTLIKLGKDG